MWIEVLEMMVMVMKICLMELRYGIWMYHSIRHMAAGSGIWCMCGMFG